MRYNTIIFDMDGVVTSEENYWNSAAMTVWETLKGEEALACDVRKVRSRVFCGDKLISVLKNKGVNSNWDLAYVTVCLAKLLDTEDFEKICSRAERFGNIMDEYGRMAAELEKRFGGSWGRNSAFWKELQERFQEWFLGDELFFKNYSKRPQRSGKTGLLNEERPLVPEEELMVLLKRLNKAGIRLGVGTGRPYDEIYYPLKSWGLLRYFDRDSFITYNDVQAAERCLEKNLTKPHPYMFIKARLGKDFPDKQAAEGKFSFSDTLVVGDAGADMLAAKAMGADFAAVLTGVSGAAAERFFRENGADHILKDVRHLPEIPGLLPEEE